MPTTRGRRCCNNKKTEHFIFWLIEQKIMTTFRRVLLTETVGNFSEMGTNIMDMQPLHAKASSPESAESLALGNRRQAVALHAKGRMLDNMAYQIRTLSNAIIGFSDLLLSEELPVDQRDYAEEISLAGKGLSKLVNEVLDWARLGAGRLEVVCKRCSLKTILDEIDREARSAATEKGLTVELHQDAVLPATLMTDSDRLVKCLINLIANAIQYTEQGGVRIEVRLEVQDSVSYVRFDIIDSGRGIAPEKLAILFEPVMTEGQANAQVVTMLSKKISAVAGLPLTRELAELLGGSLEVQSEVGKGSTFSLRIPVGVDAALAPQAEALTSRPTVTAPTAPSSPVGALPILLVEDQESNRTVIRLMLQTMGYEVETAVDGQEAVEMATTRPYSLIFMDLKMPRMDGYEATRFLRDKQIKVPIVVLSAMVLDHEESRVIAELFDGLLTKPVDCGQLLAAVRKYAVAAAAPVTATTV